MDVVYKQGKSIAYLPITDPIHAPCPDMVGAVNTDPKKKQRSIFLLEKLREKHGLKKRVKPTPNPLNYVCTEGGCLEKWEY